MSNTEVRVHDTTHFDVPTPPVTALAATESGHLVAAGYKDGSISIYRTEPKGLHLFFLGATPPRANFFVRALVWMRDGKDNKGSSLTVFPRLVAAGTGGQLITIDVATLSVAEVTPSTGGAVLDLSVHHKKDMIAAACKDGFCRVWTFDPDGDEPTRMIHSPGTAKGNLVMSCEFARIGGVNGDKPKEGSGWLYFGDHKGLVTLYDVAAKRDKWTFKMNVNGNDCSAFCIRELSAGAVAVATNFGMVKILETKHGHEIQALKTHGVDVLKLHVDPVGDVWAGGIDYRVRRITKTERGYKLADRFTFCHNDVTAICGVQHPNAKHQTIIFGSADGNLQLVTRSPDKQLGEHQSLGLDFGRQREWGTHAGPSSCGWGHQNKYFSYDMFVDFRDQIIRCHQIPDEKRVAAYLEAEAESQGFRIPAAILPKNDAEFQVQGPWGVQCVAVDKSAGIIVYSTPTRAGVLLSLVGYKSKRARVELKAHDLVNDPRWVALGALKFAKFCTKEEMAHVAASSGAESGAGEGRKRKRADGEGDAQRAEDRRDFILIVVTAGNFVWRVTGYATHVSPFPTKYDFCFEKLSGKLNAFPKAVQIGLGCVCVVDGLGKAKMCELPPLPTYSSAKKQKDGAGESKNAAPHAQTSAPPKWVTLPALNAPVVDVALVKKSAAVVGVVVFTTDNTMHVYTPGSGDVVALTPPKGFTRPHAGFVEAVHARPGEGHVNMVAVRQSTSVWLLKFDEEGLGGGQAAVVGSEVEFPGDRIGTEAFVWHPVGGDAILLHRNYPMRVMAQPPSYRAKVYGS